MSYNTLSELFTFSTPLLPDAKFYVINFTGREALSEVFFFEINLACGEKDLDADMLIGVHASFAIHRKSAEDAVYFGCITKIKQNGYAHGYCFYTVEFRSLFWRGTHFISNWIYLDQNIKQTLKYILDGEKFYSMPYQLRLADNYPVSEFSLQYNENFYDYILRRTAQQGIYFYLEPGTEKIIFIDSPVLHDKPSGSARYSRSHRSALAVQEEIISFFSLSQTILPKRVIVRSYDYKKPNDLIVAEYAISEKGIGDIYLTNENVSSREEAQHIAKVRAEQIFAQHRIFHGKGTVPFLRPGIVFTLENHPNSTFNRGYMITEIFHKGSQQSVLALKINLPVQMRDNDLYYENSFSCIESTVQYRPPINKDRRKIDGVIPAVIDGDKNNKPIIDEYGRYKVVFSFDHLNRSPGKSSCWIRRSQEQVGKDFGMAFPLTAGTEVLISFIDGDPDRPLIMGSLANGESGSISGGGNHKFSGIRTEGGTQLTFDSHTAGMSILNTSGSGYMLSSDSSDSLQSKADAGIDFSSFGKSAFIGVCQNCLSGYRLQHLTAYNKNLLIISMLMQLAVNLPSGVLPLLSEKFSDPKTDKGKIWEIGKTSLGSLFSMAVPVINMLAMPIDNYQAVITTKKEEAGSLIQCFPSVKKILLNILPVLLVRASIIGKTVFKEENNPDKKEENQSSQEYINCLQNCQQAVFEAKLADGYENFYGKNAALGEKKGKYYLGSEISPCSYYSVTTAAMSRSISLLQHNIEKADPVHDKADLEMWIGRLTNMQSLSHQLEKLYKNFCTRQAAASGYSDYAKKLSSREFIQTSIAQVLPMLGSLLAVITWTAIMKRKKIGGVLINSDDKNINLIAKTYLGIHAERGIYFNTVDAKLKKIQEWGAPRDVVFPEVDPSISSIFDKIQNLPVNSDDGELITVKEKLENGHKNRKRPGLGKGAARLISTDKKTSFIAGKTHSYNKTVYNSYCYPDYYHVSIAKNHKFSNSFNSIFLELHDSGEFLGQAVYAIFFSCKKIKKESDGNAAPKQNTPTQENINEEVRLHSSFQLDDSYIIEPEDEYLPDLNDTLKIDEKKLNEAADKSDDNSFFTLTLKDTFASVYYGVQKESETKEVRIDKNENYVEFMKDAVPPVENEEMEKQVWMLSEKGRVSSDEKYPTMILEKNASIDVDVDEDEQNFLHGFRLGKDIITLSFQNSDNNSETSVSLSNGNIVLSLDKKGTTSVTIQEKNIELNAENVIVSGILFCGNQIEKSDKGLILFGDNNLKITDVKSFDNKLDLDFISTMSKNEENSLIRLSDEEGSEKIFTPFQKAIMKTDKKSIMKTDKELLL